MIEVANKRVLVVGLGVSGASTARALLDLGAVVSVTEAGSGPDVEDRATELEALGADVETGGHDLSKLDADLAILSPGIPPTAEVVTAIADRGIEVVSEIELAYGMARCDLLAITGTNGKTTTTSLLETMLAEAGVETVAAGNIGLPLIDAVAQVGEGGAIALEVSSFQLANIKEFSPRVAVLLNIAEDHIDWHGSFEAYAAAKARIIENQTDEDVFLPNFEDAESMAIAKQARGRVVPFSSLRVPDSPSGRGIGVEGDAIVWNGHRVIGLADVPLPGVAGIEDVAAAAGAALEYGLDERAVVRAIKSFRPLGHRLEVVAEAGGITYIDDSKATNPHATLSAVRGLTEVVLIAGGRSKGIDLSSLAHTVPPVRAVVALGEAADEVRRVFEPLVEVAVATSMEEAVRAAHARSVRGGSVLLSPGCASLDMYKSYVARGEHFARCVRELIDETGGSD